MSLRRALGFTLVLAIVLPYYLFVDRPALKGVALEHRRDSLLDFDTISAITVTRGDLRFRYQKTGDGKRYVLVEPAHAFVPQDLMQAMASLLTSAGEVEVVSEKPDTLAEFGLDQPKTQMVVETPGRPEPIKILFGDENPIRTAVYARLEGSPKIFLLGRNLKYYQTLMFQWIEGKHGKKT